jgi:prepilin-type processing-associated H-X9-DG protein
MAINITRRDENFNNGVVAWTDDDELHVMSDADGGGCNVMYVDGDCEL